MQHFNWIVKEDEIKFTPAEGYRQLFYLKATVDIYELRKFDPTLNNYS